MAGLRPKGYRRPKYLAGLRYYVPAVRFIVTILYTDYSYRRVLLVNR